jgi:hypothetical protein
MILSAFVQHRLVELLNERRIVVWYDGERAFEEFVQSFKAPSCVVVSASSSTLRARRQSEAIYRNMNESENLAEAQANLLIYIPRPRGATSEARQRDPFEVFALAGVAFGDTEVEQLASLARQAMPERADEIDRLFAEGRPSLALLDRLESVRRWPLIREALGTESPAEVIALVLCQEERARRIEEVAGCLAELRRFLEAEIAFRPTGRARSWAKVREQLGTYVLFSEFALDLPSAVPDALTAIPKADEAYKAKIFSACERMRMGTDLREGYLQLANRVEAELRLAELTEGLSDIGSRDTFAFQERWHLRRLLESVQQGDLSVARALLDRRRHSVWRNEPDRALLWMAAERCLSFLDTAERIDAACGHQAGDLGQMVTAYTQPQGWAELDRQQRLFEHSVANSGASDDIAPLVDLCRRRYREVTGAIQERFLSYIQQEGWPPEGMLRQTQVFDRYLAPLLQERGKVAFFLGDSLRFEMGRDLAEALSEIGAVEVVAATSVLPASTSYGMAALMPNADGAFKLVDVEGDYFPALGTRVLKGSDDRMRLLKERYGDRFLDVTLEDLLARPIERFRSRLASVDLLVIRTQDPDQIAENLGGWRARKYLTDVVGEMAAVARRLATSGFSNIVISADHGHVMLPEIAPGDVVGKPPGEWTMVKRRSLLGRALAAGPGAMIFKAEHVGIQGDPEEICVPVGFKVFSAGASYFHEGISLQEALVPVIVVRVRASLAGQGRRQIAVRYRSDRFTSRVIGLRVECSGLDFGEAVRVRIEAYDGTSAKANMVGEAADCEARDERTHEVTLQPGAEIQVPVLIDPDFSGPKVEIRVLDPQTGVIWARCELKNALLE